MQYQISYYSPQGHAKKLAMAYKQLLPFLNPIVDLSNQIVTNNCIHLVGFEFSDTKVDEIPFIIEQFLSGMADMQVLVFATTPLCVNDALHKQAEELVLTCIPEKCKFLGFFLCQGEASSGLIEKLVLLRTKDPSNQDLRSELRMCRSSRFHPIRQDIRLQD